jgi:hypothetical protein
VEYLGVVRHQKRSRGIDSLRRREPVKASYDRLLIVCEGKKTEPNYFNEIRQKERLPSAHIKIIHSERGTEPLQIVQSAEEEFYKTQGYERIYVVFDRDDHRTYANAIQSALAKDQRLENDEKQPVSFEVIVSVPSFELWLLLHYENIQSWLHRDDAFTRLRGFIPRYAKGMDKVFELTEPYLATASQRGIALKNRFSRLPGNEPYTDVHELVDALLNLKKGGQGT